MRARAPGSAPPTTSLDFETDPELGLKLSSPRMRYTFGYTPRLTFWDINVSGLHPVLYDQGEARVEWLWKHATMSVDEIAGYGGVNYAALGPVPNANGTLPPVSVVPNAQVLYVEDSITTLRSLLTQPRWQEDLSVGYEIGGGATTDARAALPLQQGPFAEAIVTRTLRRTDYLPTTVSATEDSFSSGQEVLLTELDEGWRHLWSRITETRVVLGVSEARVRSSAEAPHTTETHPVAEGTVEHRLSRRDDVRFDARLGPYINRVFGFVDEEVQGTLAATRSQYPYTAHAYLTAAESISQSEAFAIRFGSAEIGASRALGKTVTVDAGVRGLWQEQNFGSADLLQATFFLGLTLRAPPTKL
ncbi:MAG: hypothetical protein ACRELY_29945 [Polyangiaceae bacterium]